MLAATGERLTSQVRTMPDKRDLILGVLSEKLGMATPRQLAHITATNDGSMGDTLAQEANWTQARRTLMEGLVDAALGAHGGDVDETLEAFGGEGSLLRSFGGALTMTADGDVHEIAIEEADEDLTAVTPEPLGRYRSGAHGTASVEESEELGRCGIGRVVIAYDSHLGREVALKELLPGRDVSNTLDTLSSHTIRFLREARVTGQLEHPNIVPVYELGRRPDGTLYYTMKVVRGRTMREVLDGSQGLRDRLKLLPHFVSLCQALAYAHSRGVVHRDIKPSNVMLGEFGETVLLDWGLAKVKGARDLGERELERNVELLKDSSPSQTGAGEMLGTPLYMSPEQATGKIEQIDARSDVWSLGAMFYEILTGASPFDDESLVRVVYNVIQAKPTDISERCPEAPPELAAICRRALRKERNDRYSDAKAMADEVEAYLTGDRVSSYEYSTRELISRFAKKHRSALAIIGAASVLLVVMALSFMAALMIERDRARDAEQEAVVALEQATAARAQAEDLVQFVLVDMRRKLEAVGRLELMDEVVARVTGYYERSGFHSDHDILLKGRALLVLGDVHRARGDLQRSIEAFGVAVTSLEPMAANPEVAVPLIEAYVNRADLTLDLGRFEETAADLKRALEIGALKPIKSAENGDLKFALSKVHMGLASLAEKTGDIANSLEEIEAGIRLRNELVLADATQVEWAAFLATAYQNKGRLLSDQGHLVTARQANDRALEGRRELVAQEPHNTEFRRDLAQSLNAAGELYVTLGEDASALAAFQEEEGLRLELTRHDPTNALWREDLASCHWSLGGLYLDQGDNAAAKVQFEAVAAELEPLVAQSANNLALARFLTVTRTNLGRIELNTQHPSVAWPIFESSIASLQTLTQSAPQNLSWQRDLVVTLNLKASALLSLGRPVEAREAFRQGLLLTEALSDGDQENRVWLRDKAVSYERLGDLSRDLGELAAAQEWWTKAETVMVSLNQLEPDHPEWAAELEGLRGRIAGETAASSLNQLYEQRQDLGLNQVFQNNAQEVIEQDFFLESSDGISAMDQNFVAPSPAAVPGMLPPQDIPSAPSALPQDFQGQGEREPAPLRQEFDAPVPPLEEVPMEQDFGYEGTDKTEDVQPMKQKFEGKKTKGQESEQRFIKDNEKKG
ncbi:MAG: hypothetical protein CO108_10955, partial [Deltaproteobacteria bacterium CG_4_9_14_3_um_filter_63_12]